MTYKMLKDKLQQLEALGMIDDNTVVCKFEDEFCKLYKLEDDAPLIAQTKPLITESEDMICYYKSKDCTAHHIQKKINEHKAEIEKLKNLGETVICLGGI